MQTGQVIDLFDPQSKSHTPGYALDILKTSFSRRLQAEAKPTKMGGREADEVAIFAPMDVFVSRCRRLADLFTSIHQFSMLGQVYS